MSTEAETARLWWRLVALLTAFVLIASYAYGQSLPLKPRKWQLDPIGAL